jgi:hypothetical protein
MAVPVVDMYDATGAAFSRLPSGQVASYVTGDEGVPASPAQFASRPGTVTIAQWPIASTDESPHPDFVDLEAGAVTLEIVAAVIKGCAGDRRHNAPPGPRDASAASPPARQRRRHA